MRVVAFARSIFLFGSAFRTVGEGTRGAADLDQAIGEQRFAVIPDAGLIRVQHYGDHFMPFSECGTYQYLLCGASVPSLEPVASGKMPKETIMISQLVDNSFGRLPGVVNRSDNLAKEWLLHRSSGNERQIMSGCVVTGVVQPVGIGKMAVRCSQFCRPAVHLFSKRFD